MIVKVMKLKHPLPAPAHKSLFQVILLVLILSLLTAACQSFMPVTPTPAKAGTFPVDPLFNEYYQNLGGENMLGPVISALFEEEGLKCQYTVAVLMCLDPEVTGAARYRMASLGDRIGIHEAPVTTAVQPADSMVVDGYLIYPAFVKMITSLHGMDIVGLLAVNLLLQIL